MAMEGYMLRLSTRATAQVRAGAPPITTTAVAETRGYHPPPGAPTSQKYCSGKNPIVFPQRVIHSVNNMLITV